MIAPVRIRARMREPVVEEDPTSALQEEHLPSYNAYSIDGDVTAPLVYVNYGIPEDYEQLERLGISVEGAIVIARYGGSWRGIKPKLAAEKGAVGCINYSDPQQDGYVRGEVYPKGPYRNEDGVQRGSVMDMPLYPGDPLTPGRAATKNANRLSREEAETLTKIPVLPISYGDALPLLEALEGPVAPSAWRGGLPITYHVGPGPATVRVAVKCSWEIKTIYDVIGVLEGSEFPSEWIIRGNHHDAWVHGAQDPISGMVSLLEEARAFGTLTQSGWSPKRTIIYCAWDAEEQGLLGSTEWVEAHADELVTKAVAYLNTDGYGRGFVSMSGSHSLERFINDVAVDITDPETGLSVWKRSQLKRISDAKSQDERENLRSSSVLNIGALGSGSDYTAFLNHAGVASLNLGYGGEDGGGIYHSIYDSYTWYTTFSDTGFVYGKTLAQTAGTAVLRLSESSVLPFRFSELAATADKYATELQELLTSMQEEARERNQQLAEGLYTAISDPRRPIVHPEALKVPPHLNFAPLDNALDRLKEHAERYDRLLDDYLAQEAPRTSAKSLERLNKILLKSERALTHPDGLSNRPWFKHLMYAPGLYTGYGVKTMPAIREAIEQKEWALAEREIVRLAGALDGLSDLIERASTELKQGFEVH
jgi:N-acetylated-alpha-linked acidic dipeptidase